MDLTIALHQRRSFFLLLPPPLAGQYLTPLQSSTLPWAKLSDPTQLPSYPMKIHKYLLKHEKKGCEQKEARNRKGSNDNDMITCAGISSQRF